LQTINESGHKAKNKLPVLIIAIIVSITTIYGIHTTYQSQSHIKEYSSIEKASRETGIEAEVPAGIPTENIKEIRSTMGQIIEIMSDEYVLKIARLVDIEADVLGLYGNASKDEKYYSERESISFIRYRIGYDDFPGATLINWCRGNTAYGILIDNELSENEIEELIEIEFKDYIKS